MQSPPVIRDCRLPGLQGVGGGALPGSPCTCSPSLQRSPPIGWRGVVGGGRSGRLRGLGPSGSEILLPYRGFSSISQTSPLWSNSFAERAFFPHFMAGRCLCNHFWGLVWGAGWDSATSPSTVLRGSKSEMRHKGGVPQVKKGRCVCTCPSASAFSSAITFQMGLHRPLSFSLGRVGHPCS